MNKTETNYMNHLKIGGATLAIFGTLFSAIVWANNTWATKAYVDDVECKMKEINESKLTTINVKINSVDEKVNLLLKYFEIKQK